MSGPVPRRRRARPSTRTATPVVGELGELVITAPMPSMPVGFWGDADGSRYRDTYFDTCTPASGGTATGCGSPRRQLRHHRPLRRHPEPRRRAAGHRRVLPRRRGAARGRRQPRGAPRGPGGRQRASCCCSCGCATGVELDDALRRRIVDRAADRRCRPGTSPTGSSPCRRCRTTGPARSWSCRSRRSCSAPRPDDVASRDVLADPTALDAFVAPCDGDCDERRRYRRVAVVVGTGVIGASWAAHFLARGLRRRRHRSRARRGGAAARRRRRALAALDRLGLAEGASAGAADLHRRPGRGRRARPTSSRRTARSARTSSTRCSPSSTRPPGPDVVLASSSSGLLPS